LEFCVIVFAELYAIKTAMEAPVPGIAPTTVPIPNELRMIFHIEMIFLNGGNTCSIFTGSICWPTTNGFLSSKNTWEIPNRPIKVEVKSKPFDNGVFAKNLENGILN
jgi:hypothetical protein